MKLLSKTASEIFAAVNADVKCGVSSHGNSGGKKKKGKEKANSTDTEASASDTSSVFGAIPTYQPLVTADSADACLLISLQIMRMCSKNAAKSGVEATVNGHSRTVSALHAALLLLARVLRSHRLALQFLHLGGPELLLSLPSSCRFAGNAGFAAIVLRRTLEDEPTLQTEMEAEIRAAVARLHKRQSRGGSAGNDRPSARSREFVQTVTPLICRDPLVFIRAAATSVRVETVESDAVGGRQSSRVLLLSSDERAKNVKALSDLFRHKGGVKEQVSSGVVVTASSAAQGVASISKSSHKGGDASTSRCDTPKRGRQGHRSSKVSALSKSKSPHHKTASLRRSLSPTKKGSKKCEHHLNSKKHTALNGTPANHVTSLLLVEMMKTFRTENHPQPDQAELMHKSFLWVVDYLEIIADLVLAVPTCAAAIHRYRPTVPVRHALSRFPAPPNTAVAFFLHELLPQSRPSKHKNPNRELTKRGEQNLKKNSYMKVKVSQTTARLLVALVARAGEGRRRVVADLAFALNGSGAQIGEIKTGLNIVSRSLDFEDHEMWALQSWGELCLGLAAPRSTGSSSQDPEK